MGWTRCSTDSTLELDTSSVQYPGTKCIGIGFELCDESDGHSATAYKWVGYKARALCICFVDTLHNIKYCAYTTLSSTTLSRRLTLLPEELITNRNSKVCNAHLLHPPRPKPHPQIPNKIHLQRLHLGNVLPPLHNQHLLLRLQNPSPRIRSEKHPRQLKHKRSIDGQHRTRISPSLNRTSLLPHPLLNRSLRPLPRLQTLRSTANLERSRHAHYAPGDWSRRWSRTDFRTWW